MISHILQGLLGLLGFLALAVAMSERRKSIPWKSLGVALVMQFVLALAMLKLPFLRSALSWLSSGVEVIKAASDEGARFMFGYLAGGPTPYELANPDANFVVAFQVLPLILVVSALSSVLFHVGVLPRIIGLFSIALRKVFALSGVLGFSAAASIFMGIIESPLLVKPYLSK
ncbi:MAG: Na+ dependent nucleoside transporter N-terminal domain-containing protein, partial [Myxococcota bacterium]|nr:Na+ dependent nucleoside transporter N-terminal domain-containing protein [Myxococcota bacterium]